MDPTLLDKIRDGTLKLEARLDLHGLTQAEAHQELHYFMSKAVATGKRRLLVITGKGRDGGGVLRAALPRWLMAGPFKKHILTLHPAAARHGGDGATYVLLKRVI